MRKTIHYIIEPSEKKDASYYFDVAIISLILLSIIDIVLESEASLKAQYGQIFHYFEIFSVVVFSIEYALRLYTCVEKTKYKGSITGRIKYMLSTMAVIDLLAILPFYLPFIGIDLRFIRVLRVFRIFRIFKMSRYSKALSHIVSVFREKKEELLITTSFILVILILISTLMYYLERDVQPENFSSIAQSFWWGIVTLTTVGYGDVYPLTMMGKILGGIITILGIGLIALPSGIIASGYNEQIIKTKNEEQK